MCVNVAAQFNALYSPAAKWNLRTEILNRVVLEYLIEVVLEY